MNDQATTPPSGCHPGLTVGGGPGLLASVMAVIDVLPHAVIVLDPTGNYRANATAVRVFGLRPTATISSGLDGLCTHFSLRCAADDAPIPPTDHPGVRALRGEECSQDVLVRENVSGEELMLRCHATPLRDEQGIVGAIVGLIDISDLRRSTAKLHRINEDLEQFSAIASHDLQEPLRIVRCYLSLLDFRQSIREDEGAQRYLAFAGENAARLQRMLDNLLDITRIKRQGLKRTRFDSGEAVAGAMDSLGQAVKEACATVTIPQLPAVFADRSFLIILLRNLIGNALKYRHPERSCRVAIDGWQGPHGETVFSVSDCGIGIPPDDREAIFAPFHRLPHAAPGNGLGLDICRRIAERHGGTIWVESALGVGSTFYFIIPGAHDAEPLERLPHLHVGQQN